MTSLRRTLRTRIRLYRICRWLFGLYRVRVIARRIDLWWTHRQQTPIRIRVDDLQPQRQWLVEEKNKSF